MGRVENKVAVVTGAASGLGFAAAQKLMDEGAKVLLTDINEAVINSIKLIRIALAIIKTRG